MATLCALHESAALACACARVFGQGLLRLIMTVHCPTRSDQAACWQPQAHNAFASPVRLQSMRCRGLHFASDLCAQRVDKNLVCRFSQNPPDGLAKPGLVQGVRHSGMRYRGTMNADSRKTVPTCVLVGNETRLCYVVRSSKQQCTPLPWQQWTSHMDDCSRVCCVRTAAQQHSSAHV